MNRHQPHHPRRPRSASALRLAVVTLLLVVSPLLALHLPAAAQGGQQRGKASYYSKSWTGRRTSDGTRLHHDSLTCAHRSYPFNTMLKVTNPANGRSVVVRVSDRGPFVRGRIIDLSWRAAKELDIIAQGVAMVIVERADQTVIPFRPPEVLDIPQLELETNSGSYGVKPFWQDMKRDQRDQQRAARPTQAAPSTSAPAPSAAAPSSSAPSSDALDEIDQRPNQSKAYLKRQGK